MMDTLSTLQAALKTANAQAFLRLLREGESGQGQEAYRALFGWRPGNGKTFRTFRDHPRSRTWEREDEFIHNGRKDYTTAAGAYQIVETTWDRCQAALALPDFSPQSQDLAALFLVLEKAALEDVLEGRIPQAISKCRKVWASLPSSPWGQTTITLQRALDTYVKFGGTLASAEKTMPIPAFLAAALPSLIEAVPRLARMFGSGSEVSERNLQAAEAVVGIAKEALGVKNEQELVETLRDNPAAVQTVREAVNSNWGQLDELGGGIAAAREANVAQSTIPPQRNMALWVTLMLLPLVYMTVAAVLFLEGWTSETRAMVVAAVISGVLGAITGYWLGTSFSSSKKDELLRKE